MLPSSAVQRAPCWLMCSYCPALCLAWIHGDPVSLVRQSFALWGLHSLGEGKECTIWVSHTPFLFQSCGTSLAFRGRPGEKGELQRAAVPGPGSAISSCWFVVQALTEPPSAWSVFPDKGRSWALGSCPSLGDSVNETSLPADLQNLWGEGVPSLLPIRTGYVCKSVLVFLLVFSLLTATPRCSKIPSLLQISALNAILDWAATDLPHWPCRAFSSFQ